MKGRLAAFAAALAGSAVLGVAAGLIWATVAPRALLQSRDFNPTRIARVLIA